MTQIEHREDFYNIVDGASPAEDLFVEIFLKPSDLIKYST